VNSVPYDRAPPRATNCGFCGFFGCPIDAKGDPVAPLRNARCATGRCDIRPEFVRRARAGWTRAARTGARGVRYFDAEGKRARK